MTEKKWKKSIFIYFFDIHIYKIFILNGGMKILHRLKVSNPLWSLSLSLYPLREALNTGWVTHLQFCLVIWREWKISKKRALMAGNQCLLGQNNQKWRTNGSLIIFIVSWFAICGIFIWKKSQIAKSEIDFFIRCGFGIGLIALFKCCCCKENDYWN